MCSTPTVRTNTNPIDMAMQEVRSFFYPVNKYLKQVKIICFLTRVISSEAERNEIISTPNIDCITTHGICVIVSRVSSYTNDVEHMSMKMEGMLSK